MPETNASEPEGAGSRDTAGPPVGDAVGVMQTNSADPPDTAGAAPGGRALSAPLVGHGTEPLLFELSVAGRSAASFRTSDLPEWTLEELVPEGFRQEAPLQIASVAERDLVAHFTRLTHRQYSVDLGAYPLGSCTMKYNPKACDRRSRHAWVCKRPSRAPRPRGPRAGSRCSSSSKG